MAGKRQFKVSGAKKVNGVTNNASVATPEVPTTEEGKEKKRRGRQPGPPKPDLIDCPNIPEGGFISNDPTSEGFDPKVHKPLTRKSFSKSYLYCEYKATIFEEKAKRLREIAERKKIVGDSDTEKKLNKVLKMQDAYKKLMAELAEAGIDQTKLAELERKHSLSAK